MVEIEITERVVVGEDDDLFEILRALRETGVRLAVDDFGTGSSVLQPLEDGPFDTLKADHSLIERITSSSAVVAAFIGMAADLGIDFVAEGVETERQSRKLLELGCPLAQGYLFGRPMSSEAMTQVLKDAGGARSNSARPGDPVSVHALVG